MRVPRSGEEIQSAYWWRFGRPRGELRSALAPRDRYAAANRIGKRLCVTYQAS